MKIINRLLLLTFISISILASASFGAIEVSIFKLSNQSIMRSAEWNALPKDAVIKVYNIDQLTNINNLFNQMLKRNGAMLSDNAIKGKIQRYIGQHQAILNQITQGINALEQDGVKSVPAIVFNHRYQVLGTVDLDRAYNAYFDYQRSHQAKGNDDE